MQAFYSPSIDQEGWLSETESHHALQVLRLQQGDKIMLLDGKGTKALAMIQQVEKKKCRYIVQDIQHLAPEKPVIHIAVAPPRTSERLDFLIEKLTEAGADVIHLLNTRYSERKQVQLNKLENIAIAALKQSKRPFIPVIHPACSLKEFIEQDQCKDKRVAALLPEAIVPGGPMTEDVSLLIGPEGDFSLEEYRIVLEHQYKPVKLSQHILRTESAAAFACFALYLSRLNQTSS